MTSAGRLQGKSLERNAAFHFQHQSEVPHHLDLDRAKLLATALMFGCLNYCNSLLYGIANTDLTKLQHVQKQLVHVVTKSPPFTRNL